MSDSKPLIVLCLKKKISYNSKTTPHVHSSIMNCPRVSNAPAFEYSD